MREVKVLHRENLRAAAKCVGRWQGPLPKPNKIIKIKPKAKAEAFSLGQCETKHLEIENLLGKPQPINITFKGIRGELLVCLSTEHCFPTEENNQASFLDQN